MANNLEEKSIKNIDGFDGEGNVEHWVNLVTKYNLKTNNDANVGVCKKERFNNTLGNDQLWEGKCDKRSYNTDFIGYYDSSGLIYNPEQEVSGLKDIRNEIKPIHYPYINGRSINVAESWLSDHSLVHRTFLFKAPKQANTGNANAGNVNAGQANAGNANAGANGSVGGSRSKKNRKSK